MNLVNPVETDGAEIRRLAQLFPLYDNRITPVIITDITRRRNVRIQKVPVRYRPNAASGGWRYGRDLVHCREKGNTRFDIILLPSALARGN